MLRNILKSADLSKIASLIPVPEQVKDNVKLTGYVAEMFRRGQKKGIDSTAFKSWMARVPEEYVSVLNTLKPYVAADLEECKDIVPEELLEYIEQAQDMLENFTDILDSALAQNGLELVEKNKDSSIESNIKFSQYF